MMKKFFLGVLSLVFVLCLVACGSKVTLTDIEISGQKVEFVAGDSFETGDLKVTATYSDNTTKDVTTDATVTHDADMSKAGTYTVTVSYSDLSKTYTITVEHNSTLKSIQLNTDNAKLEYKVGETIDYSNVTIVETYEDEEGTVETVDGDLSSYVVVVTDSLGNEVSGALTKGGKHTVTFSKGSVTASYEVEAKFYSSVSEAVEGIGTYASNVVSGKLQYGQNDSDYSTEYPYDFGTDYFHVEKSYRDEYFVVLSNGEGFGLYVSDGEYSTDYYPSADKVKGLSTSYIYYVDEAYGIDGLVANLYLEAQLESSYNFSESVVSETEYKFSFDAIFYDYYYYMFEVVIETNSVYGNADKVTVSYKGYYKSNMDYNGEENTYTVKADVTEYDFDNYIKCEQVAGERTAKCPYDIESMFFQSFDLANENDEVVESELNIYLQTDTYFSIANATPDTANYSVDSIKIEAYDEAGEDTYYLSGYYSSYDNVVVLYAYKVGTYKMVVKTTLVEKTYTVNVGYAEVTEITAGIYDYDWWQYVATTSTTIDTNTTITFKALVNSGAKDECTVALETESENVTLGSNEDGFTFKATVPGTYVVVLTSVENPNVSGTLEVVVEQAESMASKLSGSYEYSNDWGEEVKVEFTPDSEGALTGTVSIDDGYGESCYTYSWDEDSSSLTLTLCDGYSEATYPVCINPSDLSVCLDYYGYYYPLTRPVVYEDGQLGGKYTYTEGWDEYKLTFDLSGTGEVYIYVDETWTSVYCTFNWSLNADNTIEFTNVEDYYGWGEVTLTGTFDPNNNAVTVTCSYTSDYNTYDGTVTVYR